MDKTELCKLKDARAYIDGLMEEVPESSQAYKVLFDAWGILQLAIKEQED